jgi:3-phenylpropionate/cinnamic acid dioxygenase small subunit
VSAPCTCLAHRVTTFLARDAWLLDNWRLDAWLETIAEDIQYVVPATDCPEGDPENSVVFINDDIVLLRGRVERLKSRHAHREYPASRTRRMISNVLADENADGTVHLTASFQVYRFRLRQTAVYVGWYEMTLVPDGETFRIRRRRATLDQEALDEHGAISIIL